MPMDREREAFASNRRSFLRALTTLPLIGGGVALIGAPTAVAEPATKLLLQNYETWLAIESHRISRELHPHAPGIVTTFDTPAFRWHDMDYRLAGPSSRAALILATVGCDWREECGR